MLKLKKKGRWVVSPRQGKTGKRKGNRKPSIGNVLISLKPLATLVRWRVGKKGPGFLSCPKGERIEKDPRLESKPARKKVWAENSEPSVLKRRRLCESRNLRIYWVS